METKPKIVRRRLPEILEKTLPVKFSNTQMKYLEFTYNQNPLKHRSFGKIVRDALELSMQKDAAILGGELWV
jgi:hypothetical protein